MAEVVGKWVWVHFNEYPCGTHRQTLAQLDLPVRTFYSTRSARAGTAQSAASLPFCRRPVSKFGLKSAPGHWLKSAPPRPCPLIP